MSFKNIYTAILTMDCVDEKGIISQATDFILANNGNIIELDQHVDVSSQRFFMRIEWELEGFDIPSHKINEFFEVLVAKKYQDVHWQINFSNVKPRIGIFVSHYGHCLYDLLARYETEEWQIEIPLVISNHKDFEPLCVKHDIPFYYFEINKRNKIEQEAKQIELLKEHNVDTIILARYMQILSPKIIDLYKNHIINIHHSSLPAFPGANPYKNAFDRGVKFLGATAHYVTSELDEGPIIAQDVIHISHRDSLEDLKRRGRDIEKIVLSKAIWAHISCRVVTHKNKTVVFD